MAMHRQKLSLKPVLKDLINSLDLPPEVEMDLPDAWPDLILEPTLLRQIFQNLILNAVKFNHSSPKNIQLGWQKNGQSGYQFFVRDNGIGIDPR